MIDLAPLRARSIFFKSHQGGNIMHRLITPGLTLLAGVAIGATALGGLHAQGKPGAYAIVDIAEITDQATFNTLLPKAGPAMKDSGGQFIIRTEKFTPAAGTPPKRLVVIAFDNMDKLKAWADSPLQKEVDAIREKSTKSREFFVEAFTQ
jgi:uncharacterized protein (DUF1330 family)